jgi:D-alanyl-D-alanine-carboxypeptidase/D-alanyl-D-alanine-endopeptidase
MKILKIAGIVLLILVVLVSAVIYYARYRLNHVKDKGDLEASLDKQVARALAKEKSYGMAIGVYKAGRSFTKGYGSMLKGQNSPPDGNSIFELASTSKLFTTSLLQILTDRGLVHPDDKIIDLLQEEVPLPASAANTTLRHLATHTSGFPSVPQSMLDKMHDESNPYKDLKIQDLYDYLKTCAEKKPEGTFEYSNFGMGLLGHILALKAGTNYEEAVRSALLQPLGMGHTFVTIDSNNAGKIVQGHNEAGNPAPVWTDTVLTGAGSFLSSASDMLLFIRANLDKSNPLYPSLSKTHVPQPGAEGGLGWMFAGSEEKFMGNGSVLWHNGMAGGYASYIAIDTHSGNGIIVLSNRSVDITGIGNILMRMVNTQSWKQ